MGLKARGVYDDSVAPTQLKPLSPPSQALLFLSLSPLPAEVIGVGDERRETPLLQTLGGDTATSGEPRALPLHDVDGGVYENTLRPRVVYAPSIRSN